MPKSVTANIERLNPSTGSLPDRAKESSLGVHGPSAGAGSGVEAQPANRIKASTPPVNRSQEFFKMPLLFLTDA